MLILQMVVMHERFLKNLISVVHDQMAGHIETPGFMQEFLVSGDILIQAGKVLYGEYEINFNELLRL